MGEIFQECIAKAPFLPGYMRSANSQKHKKSEVPVGEGLSGRAGVNKQWGAGGDSTKL